MAQNYTDSSRGVLRSVNGQDYSFAPSYLRSRDPITPATSPDIKPKEQQGHYPVSSFWTNTSNQNVWVLAGIINNLGKWVLITSGGSGPLLMLTGDDGVAVSPTGAGIINLLGHVVANATHAKAVFTQSPSANTEDIDVQVSTAIAATDITKVGLAAFNNTEFTVDANGFVALVGGGSAITKVAVDAFTAPGTNPVVPASGQITVTGNQVAAGTTANVIRTDSLAANTYTVEVQRSQAVGSSTIGDNGVSHFDSNVFTVDANAFVSTTAFNVVGAANLGIAQSAGTTFTVESASGATLSASNPAYVTLQQLAAPGLNKTYKITANQSFTQANISANTWGLTAGVNWANDMPFYLYAVTNGNAGENTIAFMISRIPNRTVSPIAGNIAKAGSAVATTQGSFYSLPNVTVADYASSPCICLGSFRMTYVAAGTNWTISTLNNADGISEFNENTDFTLPVGQNGNAANTYFADNGGTAPVFSTALGVVSAQYHIKKTGVIIYIFDNNSNILTVDGVGAVTLIPNLPLAYLGNSVGAANCIASYINNTPLALVCYIQNPNSGLTAIGFIKANQTGSNQDIFNQDLTNAKGASLRLQFGYITDIG